MFGNSIIVLCYVHLVIPLGSDSYSDYQKRNIFPVSSVEPPKTLDVVLALLMSTKQ